MTDSRKRQKGPQGQPIHVAVASTSVSAPAPALGLFPSAHPPAKTPYALYTRDKRSLLAAETDQIEFESRNHLGTAVDEVGGEREGYSTQYMLGVHNPRTGTVTLHDAPVHVFTPAIKALKPTPESLASRDHHALMTAQRALLGSTFGTKKAIRALNAQQRNKLTEESFGTGTVSRGLQSHLQASIEHASASLPTAESVEHAANVARPIPPPNFAAETPAAVYATDDVVSTAELAALDLAPFLAAPGVKERLALLPGRKPQFVWTKFRQLVPARADVEGHVPNPSKKDRERLKLVVHLAYLFQFRQATLGGRPIDRARLVEKLGSPPPVVVDALLDRYTEAVRTPHAGAGAGSGTGAAGREQRKVTSFTELKLLSYLLVVVLKVDGYSTDVASIADDLGMGKPKVQELFRSLGCQLVVPSATDREKLVATGMAATVAEAAKMKKASLKVPLEFPKERKGRAKK
ncbi:hypothetical protein JCM11491_004162 [Sporobolomyces phaffii]